MADLNTNQRLTLLEVAKRRDPNGDAATIAEIINEKNAIFSDVPWMEANGALYHKFVQRLSLPEVQKRKFNKGIDSVASKTISKQIGLSNYEDYSDIDKALADASPSPSETRMQEARAVVEAITQSFVGDLFYGSVAESTDDFDGVAVQLNDLTKPTVVSNGGSGIDLTSAYVVDWGMEKAHCVYPKGHPNAGVERTDRGVQTKVVDNGKMYEVYRDHFKLTGGLVVKDPRAIGRLCNIETDPSGANTFDYKLLIPVINQLRDPQSPNLVIYVNRTLHSQIEVAAAEKTNGFYTAEDVFGRPVPKFRGIPVRLAEGILDSEEEVV
jgi:hypothetical protein